MAGQRSSRPAGNATGQGASTSGKPATQHGQGAFEPEKYLTKVSGQDYLEVKWRLVWLRQEHPEAVIETELVQMRDGIAVFKASVEIDYVEHASTADGETPEPQVVRRAKATGWAMAADGEIADWMEKGETKALGRALAHLGYGTQFIGSEMDVVETPPSQSRPERPSQPRMTKADAAASMNRQIEERKQQAQQDDAPPASENRPSDEPITENAIRKLLDFPETWVRGAFTAEHGLYDANDQPWPDSLTDALRTLSVGQGRKLWKLLDERQKKEDARTQKQPDVRS